MVCVAPALNMFFVSGTSEDVGNGAAAIWRSLRERHPLRTIHVCTYTDIILTIAYYGFSSEQPRAAS